MAGTDDNEQQQQQQHQQQQQQQPPSSAPNKSSNPRMLAILRPEYSGSMELPELPARAYKRIVQELNRKDHYKKIADFLAPMIRFPSNWSELLSEPCYAGDVRSPAEKLLDEMHVKDANLSVLRQVLLNFDVLAGLDVICLPERFQITHHPDDNFVRKKVYVQQGESMNMRCEAWGLPPPKYQWFCNAKPIENETSENLNLLITKKTQVGIYQCRVRQSDEHGHVLHEEMSRQLEIDLAPVLVSIVDEPPATVEVSPGDTVSLVCGATGYPNDLLYEWYKDGTLVYTHYSSEVQPGANNNNTTAAAAAATTTERPADSQAAVVATKGIPNYSRSVLHIEACTIEHAGQYTCRVSNSISEAHTAATTLWMTSPLPKVRGKVALVIANQRYKHCRSLETSKADVKLVANKLQSMGFLVMAFEDLTRQQMINAFRTFASYLDSGFYGFFYYAGHGFRMQENYMVPIEAPEYFLRSQTVCESELLSVALDRSPSLLVTVLDMCQEFIAEEDNPDIHREIPRVNQYRGKEALRNLLQAYSTSNYLPAFEDTETDHGIYASNLCKLIDEDIPVNRLFERVNQSIDTVMRGKLRYQIPMFSTSVTQPFRLTDLPPLNLIEWSIHDLSMRLGFDAPMILDLNSFTPVAASCRVHVKLHMDTFQNSLVITLTNMSVPWTQASICNGKSDSHDNISKVGNTNTWYVNNPKAYLVIKLMSEAGKSTSAILDVLSCLPRITFLLNDLSDEFRYLKEAVRQKIYATPEIETQRQDSSPSQAIAATRTNRTNRTNGSATASAELSTLNPTMPLSGNIMELVSNNTYTNLAVVTNVQSNETATSAASSRTASNWKPKLELPTINVTATEEEDRDLILFEVPTPPPSPRLRRMLRMPNGAVPEIMISQNYLTLSSSNESLSTTTHSNTINQQAEVATDRSTDGRLSEPAVPTPVMTNESLIYTNVTPIGDSLTSIPINRSPINPAQNSTDRPSLLPRSSGSTPVMTKESLVYTNFTPIGDSLSSIPINRSPINPAQNSTDRPPLLPRSNGSTPVMTNESLVYTNFTPIGDSLTSIPVNRSPINPAQNTTDLPPLLPRSNGSTPVMARQSNGSIGFSPNCDLLTSAPINRSPINPTQNTVDPASLLPTSNRSTPVKTRQSNGSIGFSPNCDFLASVPINRSPINPAQYTTNPPPLLPRSNVSTPIMTNVDSISSTPINWNPLIPAQNPTDKPPLMPKSAESTPKMTRESGGSRTLSPNVNSPTSTPTCRSPISPVQNTSDRSRLAGLTPTHRSLIYPPQNTSDASRLAESTPVMTMGSNGSMTLSPNSNLPTSTPINMSPINPAQNLLKTPSPAKAAIFRGSGGSMTVSPQSNPTSINRIVWCPMNQAQNSSDGPGLAGSTPVMTEELHRSMILTSNVDSPTSTSILKSPINPALSLTNNPSPIKPTIFNGSGGSVTLSPTSDSTPIIPIVWCPISPTRDSTVGPIDGQKSKSAGSTPIMTKGSNNSMTFSPNDGSTGHQLPRSSGSTPLMRGSGGSMTLSPNSDTTSSTPIIWSPLNPALTSSGRSSSFRLPRSGGSTSAIARGSGGSVTLSPPSDTTSSTPIIRSRPNPVRNLTDRLNDLESPRSAGSTPVMTNVGSTSTTPINRSPFNPAQNPIDRPKSAGSGPTVSRRSGGFTRLSPNSQSTYSTQLNRSPINLPQTPPNRPTDGQKPRSAGSTPVMTRGSNGSTALAPNRDLSTSTPSVRSPTNPAQNSSSIPPIRRVPSPGGSLLLVQTRSDGYSKCLPVKRPNEK